MSKSRGEKGRSSAQPPAAPPPVVADIVPGKLNENQWISMVEEEDGQEFVDDFIEEVVTTACSIIYDRIVDLQLIPYSVKQAEEIFIDIIKLNFLPHDEGVNYDTGYGGSWAEDEAPESGIPDNWAQGVVPVRPVTRDGTTDSENAVQQDHDNVFEEERVDEENEGRCVTASKSAEPDLDRSDSKVQDSEIGTEDDRDEVYSDIEKVFQNAAPEQPSVSPVKSSSSGKFKPYKGNMPAYRNATLTPITNDHKKREEVICNHGSSSHAMMEKNEAMRPGSLYGSSGKAVPVQKFTPERLPSRRVKTRFEVIDHRPETSKDLRGSKRKRLPAIRLKKHLNSTATMGESHNVHAELNPNGNVQPLPPPLVDVMMLSPGVVAKVGSVIKCGPKLSKRGAWQERNVSHSNRQQGHPHVEFVERTSVQSTGISDSPTSFVRSKGKAAVLAEN